MAARTRSKESSGRDRPFVRSREIGDAVSYALAHEIRIEIIVALHEREQTPAELARGLGITLSKIQHHIDELSDAGCIEEAEVRPAAGNLVARVYRAVSSPHYSAEEMAALGQEEQRATVGMALQNALAEHLAAFRADAMRGDDPDLVLSWMFLFLDEEGRAELREELEGSWARMEAIEARSATRRMESGADEARSVVVSSIAHPRVRPAPEDRRPFGPLVSPG